jgi:WD40 repeat protein
VAAGDWKSIRLADARTGKEERRFKPSRDAVTYAPAFSPDGKLLAAAQNPNTIVIWEVASGSQKLTFQTIHNRYLRQIGFSHDGRTLITLAYQEMYSWDAATGKKDKVFSGFSCFDTSSDGRTLVSDNVDYGIYLWDLLSGKQIASPSAEYITDVAYAPDGKSIAVAGIEMRKNVRDHNSLVYLVSTKDYKNLSAQMRDFKQEVVTVGFSPDGKLLAIGETYGGVSLWDVSSGSKLVYLPGAADLVPELYFSADGRTLFVAGKDGAMRLYEVAE